MAMYVIKQINRQTDHSKDLLNKIWEMMQEERIEREKD